MYKKILLTTILSLLFITVLGIRPAFAALAVDQTISATSVSGTPTTAQFSTTSANELLVAFVSSNIANNLTSTTVSGAGLTWTKQKENYVANYGLTQVWTAYATSILTNVTVGFSYTGTPSYNNTLLHVVTFTGADSSLGATSAPATGAGPTYATHDITTTADNSWIWAVGEQWDTHDEHTAGTDQTITASWDDTTDGATHWTQKRNSTTPTSGTSVTIDDTIPSGSSAKWNWILIEVKPTTESEPESVVQSYSLAAWVYPNSSVASKAIMVKNNEIRLYTNASGNIVCQFHNGAEWQTAVQSSTSITTGNWHHIACSYDKSDLRVFINGELKGQQRLTNILLNSTNNSWRFGSDAGGTYSDFNGKLDEVRIYNRALTPSEVEDLYNWAPGPVGYWKMDENTGITANDSSGNNLSASLGGGTAAYQPGWDTGRLGSALNYDGTNDYISVSDNSLLTPSGDMTIEGWFKLDVLPVAGHHYLLFDKGDSSSPYYSYWVELTDTSNTLNFTWTNSSRSIGTSAYYSNIDLTNTWYHFAFVKSGTNLYIYVNGTKGPNDGSNTGTILDSDEKLYIGANKPNNSSYFDGEIDDVRLYDYARTQGQIVEDMNAGHPAPGSPIGSAVGEWSFEEGYGDTAHNTGSVGSAINGNLGAGTSCPQSGDSACPTWSNEGKFGKALNFDTSGTTDDYVEVSDNDALDIVGDLTISFWLNPSSTSNAYIISKDYSHDIGDSQAPYIVNIDSSHIGYWHHRTGGDWNDGAKLDSQAIVTGRWTHYTIVRKIATKAIEFYVDGVFIEQDIYNGAGDGPEANSTSLKFGRMDWDTDPQYYSGKLDEVKIYNFALTADQVKLLYNQGQSAIMGALSTASSSATMYSSARNYCPPGDTGSCNPPVGEWKMDENTGNHANNTTGNSPSYAWINDGNWVTNGKFSSAVKSATCYDVNALDNASAFTFSGWYKITASGDSKVILDKYLDSTHRVLVLESTSQGQLAFHIYNGSTAYGSANNLFSLNQWFHIEEVYNGSGSENADRLKVYINGIPITLSFTGTIPSTTADHLTGNLGLGNSSYIILDNVLIYDYARTPAQVAWDYNKGAPIVYYSFDECENSILHDIAPKSDKRTTGYNGTITPGGVPNAAVGDCTTSASTMWYNGRTGKYSASLDFDGADDYVETTTSAPLQLTNMGSVSAWFKWGSVGANPVLVGTCNWGTDRNGYCLVGNSGQIGGEIANGSDKNRLYSIKNTYKNDGFWHHAVFTWDGSYLRLYIDGVSAAPPYAQTLNAVSNVYNLRIGGDPGGGANYDFDGQIDEVKIWNYALTEEQIKTEHNQGAVKF